MLVTFGTQNVQSNKNWKIFKIVSVTFFLVLVLSVSSSRNELFFFLFFSL